jgi:hypothetical protein
MPHHGSAGHVHNTNVPVTNKTSKMWGQYLTNENYIHENVNSGLNSGFGCYCSVQSPLSKTVKTNIHRTAVYLFLYGCETSP